VNDVPTAEPVVLTDRLPAGCHHGLVVRRGYTLRLTDLDGGANVGLLAFNFDDRTDRYNMADTLKAQHTAMLTAGNILMSDMGRALLSITRDDCGWHDAICGTTDAAMIASQYGELDFQDARNAYYRNGRDGFLQQLGRWGLSRRDLVANVNFFSKVAPGGDGALDFVAGHAKAGDCVDLRAELNCLVLVTSAPHPLSPATQYPSGEVEISVRWTGPGGAEDPCRTSCPQNGRALENAEAWFAQPEGGPVR
jgi:urea carboxylase-associated protein 2